MVYAKTEISGFDSKQPAATKYRTTRDINTMRQPETA
jgi:hypothetical protein